ncbi:MAG: protein translocase subunit SecF [Pseudomonadota bacterium]|jgi:preprotein translocase SecF subunit
MWWDKPNPNKAPAKEMEPFPFMKVRWVGFIVTAIITVVTTWSLMTQGLNMGLDFTGGVQIEATRETPFEVEVVRTAVAAQGFSEASITSTSDGTLVIRVPLEEGATVEEIAGKLETALGAGAKILKTDNVSGKVSGELFGKGILACLLAVVAIGAYVWFRFEVKFGTGAFVTTLHDVYAVVGLFSVTQMTFDLTIVAGVLTVAGYSINDTVVVYDRIREMLKKYRKLPITRVIDISITSTLSRTLITSLATMLAALSMAFLGGPVLFGFAVSIVFGIIIGTYSSIFVAAPLLIHLPGRIPGAKYRGEEGGPAEGAANPT